MKSERRHDLETNDLARYATILKEKYGPYASQIFGTIIVIFGLFILVSLWGGSSDVKEHAAWDAYTRELRLDDRELYGLQQVATDETYAGTAMQDWAQVTWADRQTAIASTEFFIDREEAFKRLKNVAPVYESLVENAKDEEIRNRARYGLGRTYELQDQLDKACEQYDAVTGTYELLARKRSEKLSTPEAKEVYDWLTTAKLPERKSATASGAKPAFEAELPSSGFDATSIEDILGASGSNTKSSGSDEEEPAEEDKSAPTVFDVDPIFQEEGTEGESAVGDEAAGSRAEVDSVEIDTEVETETAEP